MAYIEIFEELASNNSRLFKEEVLSRYQDDPILKRIFFMGLDPFINYFIRKIPPYMPGIYEGGECIPLEEALNLLEFLSDRTYTGHSGIRHLSEILEKVSPSEDAKVIEMIIAGDFKCGVSSSTVNKIWPGLIREYPIMLASKTDQKLIGKLSWPACVELKHDGMRANAVVKEGKVTFYARSGKILDLLGNLEEEFLEMATDDDVCLDVVYDGELEVRDNNGKLLPRKQANGICSKALKGTISEAEASMICFALWDRIPYDEWYIGFDHTPYDVRYDLLDNDWARLRYNSSVSKISLVGWDEANNFEEAYGIFESYLAEGEEGIIIKNINSPWENARSKQHIKLKAERSADMLCTGVAEGSGKYAGLIGALQLTTSDGLIECSCGTGMSDDDRKKDPSEYIGKIIEIVFNEKIQSKGDKKMSLFLPVFRQRRLDKTIANSSTEI